MSRLPFRLPVHSGESLTSYMTRVAYEARTTRGALLGAAGVGRDATPADRLRRITSERLSLEELSGLAAMTGVPETRLADMTVASLDGRAFRLNEKERSIARHTLWSQPGRTKVCIDCLIENDGARQLGWRLVWHFSCVQHQRVLLDICPSCQGFISTVARQPTTITAPWTCGSAIKPDRKAIKTTHERCEFDLREASSETLEAAHPIIQAQEHLQSLIAGPESNEVVWDRLRDYQALSIGLLIGCDGYEIAERAGLPSDALQGLWFPPKERNGTAPPDDSFFAGATITAADQILRAGAQDQFELLEPLVLATSAQMSETTPSAHLKMWGGHAKHFEYVMLKAIDKDLTLVDRLRHQSMTPIPAVPNMETQEGAEARARFIPQAFWPRLSLMNGGGAFEGDAYRAGLSAAVAIIGRTHRRVDDAYQSLGWEAKHPEFRSDFFGHGDMRETLLTVITDIHHELMQPNQIKIDFGRRRTIDFTDVLPADTWQFICDAARHNPGDEQRRFAATLFLARRISGSIAPKGAPQCSAESTTLFLLGMTAPLLRAMDAYAARVLEKLSIHEPVVIEPMLTPGARLLAESSISAESTGLLHDVLRGGVRTFDELERTSGLTRLQIRLLQELEPPTVEGVKLYRWRWPTELIPKLDRKYTRTSHTTRRKDAA